MMRTGGNAQIHPNDGTKTRMLRDGLTRTTGVVKVCISDTGQVARVNIMKSTKYPDYDAQLLAGVRSWTYRPYAAKGRNVRVCGVVTFVYGISGR
jgi:TonB family protein